MRRKFFSVMTVLVLIATMLSAAAFADMDLTSEVNSDGEWVNECVIANNSIYMFGRMILYRWKDGETGLTRFSLDVPGLLRDFGGQKKMFQWDGEPWLLLISPREEENNEKLSEEKKLRKITAVRIALSDNAAAADAFDIEADDLVRDLNDDSVDVNIDTVLGIGKKLYMVVNTDFTGNKLYCYDKETKEYKEIKSDNIGQRMIPTDGGKMLVECKDDNNQTTWFEEYDPASGTFTKHGGEFKTSDETHTLSAIGYDGADNTLYYQDKDKLIAAPGFDPAAAKTVTTLSEPAVMGWLPGGVLPGKRYVYFIDKGAKIIDISASAARTETFKVLDTTFNNAAVAAAEKLKELHSDVTAVMDTRGKTDTELIDGILKNDSDADIYIVTVDSQAYNAMYERGYLPEITNPEVKTAVEGMYPSYREVLTKDGKTVAVPVLLYGDTIGINENIMKEIGIDPSDLPTDWTALLKKLPEWNGRIKDHDKTKIFEIGTTVSMAKHDLLDRMIDTYLYDMRKNGADHFNTPELAEAVRTILDLDYLSMGAEEDRDAGQEDDDRPMPNPDAESLISLHAGTPCGSYTKKSAPLAMTVLPGKKPYIPIYMSVAVINPYSKHKELAQEYMALLLKQIDNTTAYSLSAEKNEPVPDKFAQQSLEETKRQISVVEKNLETAQGAEKESLEQRLTELKASEKSYDDLLWQISKESIDWYRAHTDSIYVQRYKYLDFSVMNDLENSLIQGKITMERFLREFDEKLNMMKAEDAA